jgi:hypothetical protein
MATRNVSLDELDPSALGVPEHLLDIWNRLLNFCEAMMAENERLRKELSAVKRELAKFKGQSPKPDIKPNCKDETKSKDRSRRDKHRSSASSEQERSPRNQRIEIDREQIVRLPDDARPQDFRSTGFRNVVVQNITLKTDNVRYKLERGYSARTGEFHEATLPPGVEPGYGAELQALILTQYFQLRVPQPKLHQLLTSQGIVISTGQISEIITKKHIEMLQAERTDVLRAGLWATTFQQIDDTGMRVDGVNHYVITLCSPYYSCFFTRRHKNATTIERLISEEMGDPEATLNDYVWILIGDDAGQFHDQTSYRGLCWIHEERHYRKLRPYFKNHQKMVDDFRGEIWDFYDQLKAYQSRPSKKEKRWLSERFDELFGQTTGYVDLDHRIGLTRAKKEHLLLALDFPELPLDNNESERTLREWVIKRRISGGTRSLAGTKAWDTTLSLCDTARKLGQNFYAYLVDRISGRNELPSLADQIFKQSGTAKPDQAAA